MMPDQSSVPLVSVILPVRNEAAYIRRSLGSVLAQDYPDGRLEILVIDGMSTDGTRETIKEMKHAQEKYSVRLIDNPRLVTPVALNCGLNHARGQIVIRVDGHCEIAQIAPDYVRRCVQYLQTEDIDGVGGVIETIGNTYKARAIAIAMSVIFGVGNSSFRTQQHRQLLVDTIPFPAYRLETIRAVGAYDEEMLCNEDDEYNYRLRERGGRLLLANDISSRYYCRGSLRSLWQQYLNYGLWKIRVMQKHSGQMRVRQFIPSTFVFTLVLSLLVAFSFPWGWVLFIGMVGSYSLANLGASLLTAARRGWQYLPLLPVIFAILHFSYGIGFLTGLVKFWNRWGDNDSEALARSGETLG
jgi:glycosyltransferase involved in cell wall biosynthesis